MSNKFRKVLLEQFMNLICTNTTMLWQLFIRNQIREFLIKHYVMTILINFYLHNIKVAEIIN